MVIEKVVKDTLNENQNVGDVNVNGTQFIKRSINNEVLM